MDFLPIFLNIRERACLVVGGGSVAERKVSLLLDAGARVTVVSSGLCDSLKEQSEQGTIDYRQGEFNEDDLQGKALIIAATDDREVNESIASWANQHNVPVNVVDNPDAGSFIMPSIIDRSPVQIAVSTGGSSPVLARTLRSKL